MLHPDCVTSSPLGHYVNKMFNFSAVFDFLYDLDQMLEVTANQKSRTNLLSSEVLKNHSLPF